VLCRFSAAVSGSQVPGAAEIGWYDNTVRRWLHRFNAAGIDGLGNRPGAERRRPITEAQRSAIVAMARSVPPGRLARDGAGAMASIPRSSDTPPGRHQLLRDRLPGHPRGTTGDHLTSWFPSAVKY
jgi:hypothetical protein